MLARYIADRGRVRRYAADPQVASSVANHALLHTRAYGSHALFDDPVGPLRDWLHTRVGKTARQMLTEGLGDAAGGSQPQVDVLAMLGDLLEESGVNEHLPDDPAHGLFTTLDHYDDVSGSPPHRGLIPYSDDDLNERVDMRSKLARIFHHLLAGVPDPTEDLFRRAGIPTHILPHDPTALHRYPILHDALRQAARTPAVAASPDWTHLLRTLAAANTHVLRSHVLPALRGQPSELLQRM